MKPNKKILTGDLKAIILMDATAKASVRAFLL
jgi:hypothetical protein